MLKTLQCFCCAVLCSIPASSHKGSAPAELSARLSQSCSRGRRALQMQQQEPTCPTLSQTGGYYYYYYWYLFLLLLVWPGQSSPGEVGWMESTQSC